MNRSVPFAMLAVVAALTGCSGSDTTPQDPSGSDGTTASGNTSAGSAGGSDAATSVPSSVEPVGIYQVQGSPDFLWLKLQTDGRYGTWAAGDTCNKDPSTAPASCLVTGTYVINEARGEIQFTDDLTGSQVVSPYQVTAVGMPAAGGVTTMNTSGSKSQKPTATAWNLRKCIHTAAMVCNLFFGGETLPEIQKPLPPRAGQTQQG